MKEKQGSQSHRCRNPHNQPTYSRTIGAFLQPPCTFFCLVAYAEYKHTRPPLRKIITNKKNEKLSQQG